MKQALLIGCGNQRGEYIIKGCIEAGYNVTNIGASNSTIPNVTNISINWKKLDLVQVHKILKNIETDVNFIFFNQNSSSLSQDSFTREKETLNTWRLIKSWTNSYWLSCQMPYFIIKTLDKQLSNQTTIGWMLSSYIDSNKKGVSKFPDYSGYKFTNYLLMKNFSKHFKCFGINPDFTNLENMKTLIKNICSGNKTVNGEIF